MPLAPQRLDLAVHSTHEAGVKVGGIGAVLDGLLSTRAYGEHVQRTVLAGPFDADDTQGMDRLAAARNGLEIRFSSPHGVDQVSRDLSSRLRAIEEARSVRVLYGVRPFGQAQHEVILVDPKHAPPDPVNAFKAELYMRFGVQSDRYEHDPEYSLYINAAEAQYETLLAIAGKPHQAVIIAHEFMGLPLCFAQQIHDPGAYRTLFYGHEVATVRPIVELSPGHDTMFYNVLVRARERGLYLEDVFGDQSAFFKHALIRTVPSHCDGVLAVGDRVVQEMRFLSPDWEHIDIDLVYNGIPSHATTLREKATSRARLQEYCANLLGFVPDYVFTHVTRLVPSKGLWRDLRVMEHLDPLLAHAHKRAVLFVLSSAIPAGRPPHAIHRLEGLYGWPVRHREESTQVDGRPVHDLVSHEVPFYHAAERFNRAAASSAVVLVNQFGWSRNTCGRQMPAEMAFVDIRRGSDVEFGQSIYEPFGIAQLEPLCHGALCAISSVCGCVGFLRRVGGADIRNTVIADYESAGERATSLEGALAIDQASRDAIERQQARVVARKVAQRLPRDESEAQELLTTGRQVSTEMSWDVVARDYLVPALKRLRQD